MDAVTTPTEDVTAMTDEQLAEQAQRIEAERMRRAVLTDAEQRTDAMCLEYLRASGRENGGPWEAPLGFLGAYPRGWRVTHDGRTYESVDPGTVAAPPGDGWTAVPAGAELIDFWEDREYEAGEQVRDAGRIWTATTTAHGARPSEFPGGWTTT